MKLSVIIVNYNVTDLLRECLRSLYHYIRDVDFEIIVVDNHSPDISWKNLIGEFSNVQFIASESNDGFAIANNKAVSLAKGEYILLLNPDTEFEDFYMNEILKFADSKEDLGCLGVQMHNAAGSFLPESKRSVPDMFNSFHKLIFNFRNKETKSYYRNDILKSDIAEVEVITGAFLLIKKDTYEAVGGLDEMYFMYGEDIDLCFSLLLKNYKNWYYGKASILHHKGESTVKDLNYLNRFYGAMQIFLNKYYLKKKPLTYLLLSLGLKVKFEVEKFRLK